MSLVGCAQALPSVIAKHLAEPERVTQIAAAGRVKALTIAPEGFWRAINAGLQKRKLRSLGIE